MRWAELVETLRGRGAPFANELAALVPELVALEAYLGGPPRELRTCHRGPLGRQPQAGRARLIRAAYAEAGGPGRVEHATDFAMAIAQLSHILVEGCRRWLAAGTDAHRADNEGWVREFLDQPRTRAVSAALLAD